LGEKKEKPAKVADGGAFVECLSDLYKQLYAEHGGRDYPAEDLAVYPKLIIEL
jgi:hypothetical protein